MSNGDSRKITERKQSEEQLRRNHETLFNLVQNAPFGIYIVDADFRLTQISKGSVKVFSNVDSPIGRDFAGILRTVWEEPFATEAIERFRHTLLTGEPYRSSNTTEQRGDIEDVESYDWKIERITLPDGRYGVVCYFYDLTERMQFEEQLRESEERMRLVLGASKLGVWIYDFTTQRVYRSAEHDEIFGTNNLEPTAEAFFNAVHPDDVERVRAEFKRTIENRRAYEIEFRIIRPDGQQRWVKNQGHAKYDADGRPLQFLGIVFDITGQRRRELNLAFLADLQKALGDLSSAVEILHVAGARIARYLNLSHCLFVEISEAADEASVIYDHHAPGMASLVAIYPLREFHTEAERQQLSAGQLLVVNDVRDDSRLAEGAARFEALGIRSLVSAPYISEGRWKFVLSAQHDHPSEWREDETELLRELSAQICLRLERANAEEALRENEKRLALALASASMGVWTWDLQTNAVHWSPEHYAIFGIDSFDGTLEAFARTLHPADADYVLATVNGAIESRLPYEAEFRIITGDGVVRWVGNRGRAEYDADGKPLRMLGIVVNIEERKQAEAERSRLLDSEQSLRAAAEEANRLKDEFIANASHELRTPLTAIVGWARMLRSGNLDEKTSARALTTIERNAHMQTKLIEDLLDISGIISGKLVLDIQSVQMASVISDAVNTVRPAAQAKNITIEVSIDPLADSVPGDANRLQQVVWNLLSNAVKFTPKDGRVTVALQRVNAQVEISVCDTGEGIEPEFLPYVFDRFRQADGKTTKKHGGLGLGLAIVRHLVELHGGTVKAHSSGLGYGASFIISLPLVGDYGLSLGRIIPPLQKEGLAATNLTIECPPNLDGLRVLIIDDDHDTLEMLGTVLSQCEAEVVTVASAAEAILEIKRRRPDVLVSDIGIPDEDGYELIKRVRAMDERSEYILPALALTAYAKAEDRVRALAAGYQMHLAKPVEPEEFVLVVANLAGNLVRRDNQFPNQF